MQQTEGGGTGKRERKGRERGRRGWGRKRGRLREMKEGVGARVKEDQKVEKEKMRGGGGEGG